MKLSDAIYVTPSDLWPGASIENVREVVAELRRHGIDAYPLERLERRHVGLAEILTVADSFRMFLPTLIDEAIEAAEAAQDKAGAAVLRQARADLKRRQAALEAAQTAVIEAAERLAELEARQC